MRQTSWLFTSMTEESLYGVPSNNSSKVVKAGGEPVTSYLAILPLGSLWEFGRISKSAR